MQIYQLLRFAVGDDALLLAHYKVPISSQIAQSLLLPIGPQNLGAVNNLMAAQSKMKAQVVLPGPTHIKFARSLRRKRSYLIGIVAPDFGNGYEGVLLRGFERLLVEHGLYILCFQSLLVRVSSPTAY